MEIQIYLRKRQFIIQFPVKYILRIVVTVVLLVDKNAMLVR